MNTDLELTHRKRKIFASEEERIIARKIASAKHYEKNKEKIKKRSRDWENNNRQKVRDRRRKYTENNIEKFKQYHSEYYKKNKPSFKIYAKKRALLKHDEIKKKNKEWVFNNKEKVKYIKRKYRISNKGKISSLRGAHKRLQLKKFIDVNVISSNEINDCRNKFNNSCFNCGSIDNLELDHNFPLSKGFPLILENAVILCKSCNSSKKDSLPEEFYSEKKLSELYGKYGLKNYTKELIQ